MCLFCTLSLAVTPAPLPHVNGTAGHLSGPAVMTHSFKSSSLTCVCVLPSTFVASFTWGTALTGYAIFSLPGNAFLDVPPASLCMNVYTGR